MKSLLITIKDLNSKVDENQKARRAPQLGDKQRLPSNGNDGSPDKKRKKTQNDQDAVD